MLDLSMSSMPFAAFDAFPFFLFTIPPQAPTRLLGWEGPFRPQVISPKFVNPIPIKTRLLDSGTAEPVMLRLTPTKSPAKVVLAICRSTVEPAVMCWTTTLVAAFADQVNGDVQHAVSSLNVFGDLCGLSLDSRCKLRVFTARQDELDRVFQVRHWG
jgi:hypothetical protein